MSSDEEMPPMGGEDSDDESAGGIDMPNVDEPLPEGIEKEIITEGSGSRRPTKGDDVTVHYVGTLASDGTEFDSSRKRDKPFVFSLGMGGVIMGWDYGVATMRKGERAKFTLAPEFAYGESGSPPTIPAEATLVFDVELISWASKDDLFGDDGVIKCQLEEAKGWKKPSLGDEVKLTLTATVADGLAEQHPGIDYVVGSNALGPLGKAVDKALLGMKKSEKLELKCTKEYAYGDKHPDGATLTLTLEEVYETKDVSFDKDGALMKKRVKEGDGFDTVEDGAKVTMVVSAVTDGDVPLPGFTATTLEFPAGNGEVCDALEVCALEMKRAERAVVTAKASLCTEAKLGLRDVKSEKVVLTIELVDFEKAKDVWDMSEEEKVEFGTARKEIGTNLLKAGRLHMALERYRKVGDMFSNIDNFKEDTKVKATALKQACESNKAAVFLKLGLWNEARKSCETVLKGDRNNVKALYRQAQAQLHLKNFLESIADCKKVVQLDPQNKEVRALLKQAQAGQKEEDKKSKGLFANMCKALGKGPIPEPGQANRIGDFSDAEGDEDDSLAGTEAEAEEKENEDANKESP